MKENVLKHAYLIMAHDNFSTLETLLLLLDHENNDFYIHIDRKTDASCRDKINVSKLISRVFFVESIDIKWGHYSQIECELNLIKAATKRKYDYYHLLSGMDLPIKSQKYIQSFFVENSGKEFVHFDSNIVGGKFRERIKYFYILQPYMRSSKYTIINYCFYYLNRVLIQAQKILNINRNSDVNIQKGANWFSITHNLAEHVINKETWIRKIFKYTANPDELFLQTLVENSHFKENLYYKLYDNSYVSCLRYIDWNRGNPYVWKLEDYDELVNSDYLFARKFDEKIDNNIIVKLCETLRH